MVLQGDSIDVSQLGDFTFALNVDYVSNSL